jgi:hypothetical protein
MTSVIQCLRQSWNVDHSDQRISIVIRKWDTEGIISSNDASFSIKTTSALRSIFRIFALREAPHSNCVGYFKFMYGDKHISGDHTPDELTLSDGDCIDAFPCVDEDVVGSRFV